MIYTHDTAAKIIEMFEDVLISNNICVPSPEDDERDKYDMVGLYGSTYSDLLDNTEQLLISIICEAKSGVGVITHRFSGNC